jgi:hypothetical protein
MVFPYADGTNSFERSTVMVSLCPSRHLHVLHVIPPSESK